MSTDEIEKMAIDLSRKAGSALPKDAALLGVSRVNLTNSSALGIDILIEWSRACARADLSREGVVIDPEVFRSPVLTEIAETQKSVKIAVQGKSAVKKGAQKKTEK